GAELPTGDFTTAPEMSPLFGQTIARQAAQVLKASQSVTVLEFGAGSGALAADVIPALGQLGIEPQYQILAVSADLQQRQQQRLAEFGDSVTWLTALPMTFSGFVLANEVLDAMPATLFSWNDDGAVMEIGVRLAQNTSINHQADPATVLAADVSIELSPTFEFAQRPANAALRQAVAARMPPLPGYQSEINLQAEAWVRQMGTWLKQGAALLIDYGFPQREYYHPQRSEG